LSPLTVVVYRHLPSASYHDRPCRFPDLRLLPPDARHLALSAPIRWSCRSPAGHVSPLRISRTWGSDLRPALEKFFPPFPDIPRAPVSRAPDRAACRCGRRSFSRDPPEKDRLRRRRILPKTQR